MIKEKENLQRNLNSIILLQTVIFNSDQLLHIKQFKNFYFEINFENAIKSFFSLHCRFDNFNFFEFPPLYFVKDIYANF